MKTKHITIIITSIVICHTATLLAADWPCFRGPNGDCTSSETGLIKSWRGKGLTVLWTADLGPGFGAPVARDHKVYLLDREQGKKDILRCWDLATGKEQWTFAYDAPGDISVAGSRSSPTVNDKHVFTLGTYGDLHCVSRQTKTAVWKTNLSQA